MRPGLLALLVSSGLTACGQRAPVSTLPAAPSASAVTPQAVQQEFQPDRPDVANSTHVVPVGLLQVEAGGQWTNVSAGNDNVGFPFSLRLGLRDWLEARVESFDDVYESSPAQSRGLSGVSTAAKVSFSPAFAIIPAIQLPVGSQSGTDYLLTLITGTDFGDANHVDANYGLAAISATPGHFFQQWLAVSVNRQVTNSFSPYVEVYWFSHQDAGSPAIVSTDLGFIYTFNERLAFDCGADIGLNASAARARLFAGLTVIVAEVFGHRGVHGRLKEAAERHGERSK